MRSTWFRALALVALLPLSVFAQRNRDRDRDRDREQERERSQEMQDAQSRIDTTFAFSKTGVVDLRQISGDVVVNAWDRGEARVRAYAERGRIRTSLSSSRLSLEVESVRGRIGDSKFEVSVPVGVRVIARSTSGDVTVKGTKGAVDAHSTSGDVIVSDATDRIVVESVSGDVRGSQLNGDVRSESVSGTIEIRDATGDVHAETTSGDVSLTGVTSRNVVATTVSGEVEYDGTVDANGRYEFHSHSGDIRLEIPETASASFSVETFSGSLDSEFPITLQPGQRATGRPRRFEFTLGNGGARITAESFSGDIVLARRARRQR
jgi:putative adhesin